MRKITYKEFLQEAEDGCAIRSSAGTNSRNSKTGNTNLVFDLTDGYFLFPQEEIGSQEYWGYYDTYNDELNYFTGY